MLRELEPTGPFVFGNGVSAPHPTTYWRHILKAGGPSGNGVSWHSLRKSARTLMARAGVRADHAERALGHVQGAVERAYDKHEYLIEKRAAFEALAAEIARVVEGGSSNVVNLGRAA